MICPNCGASLPDGAVFCGSCGAQISAAEIQPDNQQMYDPSMDSPYDQQPYNPVSPGTVTPPKQGGGPGFGIASMVLGIVSLVFVCCSGGVLGYVTFITSIVGLVLGGLAVKNGNRGKGMAIAGIVCSIIALVFSAIIVLASCGSCIGCSSCSSLAGLSSMSDLLDF